jgi:hypothetical protein
MTQFKVEINKVINQREQKHLACYTVTRGRLLVTVGPKVDI